MRLMKIAVTACFTCIAPAIAHAEFSSITTKADFVNAVSGKDLTILGIKVRVLPDGGITGRAYGRDVRGQWRWSDGYFCRDLYWGKRDLGPNCQAVGIKGDVVRFQSDKGTGQHADLRLR